VPGHRLDDSIRTMIWWSDSNIAEMVFRHTALASGRPATWAGARSAAVLALQDLGVPMTGVRLIDGSGLSRLNRLTPQFLVDVMSAAQRPAETRMRQITSLVMTAGRTGTLATSLGRFATAESRCAIGKFWGKSGTLDGVITLTGYARGADGRLKVLAFMVNERNTAYGSNITRRYIDRLVATVVGCY
jgi:D-alanyl-D-alanine carboxypeptidase/D-alanyl-D-alanine-endopeptidase (penicillin-binding protein 4)